MNTDINMMPKVVVFVILILGMISIGCNSEIHAPVDQAREIVTTMNRMDVNRFEVKKTKALDDQNIQVILVARNTSMICNVSLKPLMSRDGSPLMFTSNLGRMAETDGKKVFVLVVVNQPSSNLKCESSTGDFPPGVIDYIDFEPAV